MIAVYITVLALFIALALVPLLARWADALGLIDQPDERKIHQRPIPRVGGIAIAAGSLGAMLVWLPLLRPEITGYLVGASVILLFGVLDDRFNLDYRLKFAAQIAGVLMFIGIGGVQLVRVPFFLDATLPAWLGLPLTVLVMVGITNAVNLSDGMDGLAGGTSLITAAALGYLAYLGGDNQVALVALALVGAIFGFLRYNTFPAQVFMGDAGSQFLGFSVAVLGMTVIEQSNTAISPLVPVLILGLPIIDTLYVMTRRIIAGGSPFMPDRRHLHHRLLDGGLSQYQALLVIYGLQLTLVGMALGLRYASDWLLLVLFVAFVGVLLGLLNQWRSSHAKARAMAKKLDFVDPLVAYLKANGLVLRVAHHGLVYGVSLLFLSVALWTPAVTPDIGWLAVLSTVMVLLALVPARLLPRKTIYRLVAFVLSVSVVYLAETEGVAGLSSATVVRVYLLLLAVFVALWLRFGFGGDFRFNTLDVLVILLVAILPQMPLVKEFGIGIMIMEVLLLFYACELIESEREERWALFRAAMLVSLIIIAVRGIAQF